MEGRGQAAKVWKAGANLGRVKAGRALPPSPGPFPVSAGFWGDHLIDNHRAYRMLPFQNNNLATPPAPNVVIG